MPLIAEYLDRVFYSEVVTSPEELRVPFSGHLFPCLLWDHTSGVGPDAKESIARALLKAGCRYAVCAGRECEEWHDTFDAVHVEDHLDDTHENDDEFVMTTWHEGESPDEVASFFVRDTNFEAHEFKQFLVLHVGKGAQQPEVDKAVIRYGR